jgi:hypothetical protein
MKPMNYVVALLIALCAVPSVSHAQTVQFLASGSSAMFYELGQGAQSSSATNTPCLWTHFSDPTNVFYTDNRPATPVSEAGEIWITWSPGSTGSCMSPSGIGINIYADMNLDSVLGQRCFFEVDNTLPLTPGCVLTITATEVGTFGTNELCVPPPGVSSRCVSGSKYGPDTSLPLIIQQALNGRKTNAAATDIRPEDAKFASLRMFTACGAPLQRQPFDQILRSTFGLGYQTGVVGVGTTVSSFYSTKTFHVLDFNIAGNDPISGHPTYTAYSVSTVGATPIVVTVGPVPTSGNTGIGAASDITLSTLQLFYAGVAGRSTDLVGPSTANAVTTLVPEPLSGTYNIMEFSAINNNEFHGSQDIFNCTGNVVASNPMHLQGNNAAISSFRNRVIGTGEMVLTAQVQTIQSDTLGYWLWSAQKNAAYITATANKYLTVNGVEPLQNAYTNGVIPTTGNGNLGNVTFKYLNQGDYPIWSAVRIVSTSPTPAGVTNVVAAANSLTESYFIKPSAMQIWHSHFNLQAIGEGVQANGTTISAPGDLCGAAGAVVESGGDAGGSTVMKQVNFDFCSDYGSVGGLIGQNN